MSEERLFSAFYKADIKRRNAIKHGIFEINAASWCRTFDKLLIALACDFDCDVSDVEILVFNSLG